MTRTKAQIVRDAGDKLRADLGAYIDRLLRQSKVTPEEVADDLMRLVRDYDRGADAPLQPVKTAGGNWLPLEVK